MQRQYADAGAELRELSRGGCQWWLLLALSLCWLWACAGSVLCSTLKRPGLFPRNMQQE